ncbi:chemotaxis protein CheA [Chryseolinea lacunae]|uniref:Chemotaxis protein CheA n=1 Tax=Chryseolinea lacunae TaxID=2801331 RepID=A0ABS1KMQ9_9BACT|nr:chemotaxis protein CheA [Chryseolinea lacunae]MBL0740615.1 chemotaxis protein CheA [Chryseolinea lacunae]
MDKFKAIFLAEAEELMVDLEKALLDFEQDLHNDHPVKEIFRIMHTLKGGGSMFGFEHVSSLTHDLETIYDGIREKKITPTKEILEVTLTTVDHLKKILHDPMLEEREHQLQQEIQRNKIKALLGDVKVVVAVAPEKPKELSTYYVLIEPIATIFKNGTNPLYLVDDVTALGEAFVMPDLSAIPTWAELQGDVCYTQFEIALATERPASEINDVFIFAEELCKVTVQLLAQENLLAHPAFLQPLQQKSLHAPGLGYDGMKALADALRTTAEDENTNAAKVNTKTTTGEKRKETSIRVSSDKLEELMNLVSELVTSQAQLSMIAGSNTIAALAGLSENMEKITRRLRDNAFSICLVPIETLVTRFQRLVRDLSKDLQKEISFTASGTETELDKSIIDTLSDPLLHIIRNSLDHGIESPSERLKNNKPAKGTIHLHAFHAGTHVYIQLKDDGKGIDPEKIRKKAIERGLLSPQATPSQKEILDFIFAAGFSTAEKITDVSGRGVGMDVVRRNIEAIHGEVSIESELGKGTIITLKLPLTLSIIDGMRVRVGNSDYIIPLSYVEKCFEMPTAKIKAEVIQRHVLDGELLPVINLHEAFHEPAPDQPITQIIKLKYAQFPVAITIDAIVGEYQAVMKPLGDLYQGQDEFSGATILGDGSVALVIDTDKLVHQLIVQQEKSLSYSH